MFKGDTLALLAEHPGLTIGVDSFVGMPKPSDDDLLHGTHYYPEGKLAAGMEYAQKAAPTAALIKGFVPEVLVHVRVTEFAFAHVDMDQFHSTLEALHWLWPRMMVGGILCCDDWFENRTKLAAGAIALFGRAMNNPPQTYLRKAWWVKCSLSY